MPAIPRLMPRTCVSQWKRLFHRTRRSSKELCAASLPDARWIGLREVKIIGRHAVACYFCENACASCSSGIEIFQGENRCPFTQDHASAISIKRAAFFRRRGLKRIKPDKDQFRECVVTTGQYALITARSHAFERMAD